MELKHSKVLEMSGKYQSRHFVLDKSNIHAVIYRITKKRIEKDILVRGIEGQNKTPLKSYRSWRSLHICIYKEL